MKKFCLALDLIDDERLIEEYAELHKTENAWPEVTESIKDSGIINMEIYRIGNRLFMIMETVDEFEFDNKSKMDALNPKVQEWEELMWKFQQPLKWAAPDEKWVLMDQIYKIAP